MLLPYLLSCFTSLTGAWSTIQVAGGNGAAQRIQAAVDVCPTYGCTIELPDAQYPMEAPVWILNRSDIRLIGTGPSAPVFVWKDSLFTRDTAGVAALFQMPSLPGGERPVLPAGSLRWPTNTTDSTNPYYRTGFQHNGMFNVENSTRIEFNNLILDGNKLAMFYNVGVLNGMYSILFGSVGITFLKSLASTVTHCEFRHFWSAMYMNNRNTKCAAWTTKANIDLVPQQAWTDCGKMGGHLIERNRIHGNWWAIYSESQWDQGSVIRENVAWNNANQFARDSTTVLLPNAKFIRSDNEFQASGFIFSKDAMFPADVVSHNTLVDNPMPYAHSGYHAAGNALWSDDILDALEPAGSSWMQLFRSIGSPRLWNSTVQHQATGAIWGKSNYVEIKDSTFKTTMNRLVVRDSAPGAVSGGQVLRTPIDTTDTLINGQIAYNITYYTYTLFYDTLVDTVACKQTCYLTLVNGDHFIRDWQYLPWNYKPLQGGWWTAVVRDAYQVLHSYRLWDPQFCDSSGLIKFYGNDSSLTNHLGTSHCRNCRFASNRTSDSLFLVPKWSDSSGTAPFNQGFRGNPQGAFGRDNRLGSHVPVRVRATGMPSYDNNTSTLSLPVSWFSEGAAVQRLSVARARATRRQIVINSSDVLSFNIEPMISIGAIPDVNAGDSVIKIPFTPNATDSIYQFDLWLVGISGTDTLAATPMSWVWSPRAASGHSFTVNTSTRTFEAATSIRRVGRHTWLRWTGAAATKVTMTDLRGRTVRLTVHALGTTNEADLSACPKGIWLPDLPGARPVTLF